MKKLLISSFITSALLGAGAAFAYKKWGNNAVISIYNKIAG